MTRAERLAGLAAFIGAAGNLAVFATLAPKSSQTPAMRTAVLQLGRALGLADDNNIANAVRDAINESTRLVNEARAEKGEGY